MTDAVVFLLKACAAAAIIPALILASLAVLVAVGSWSDAIAMAIRQRRAAALATPVLKGVPLPSVGDPRWRIEYGLFERKMNQRLDRMRMGDFQVWILDGEVLFRGRHVGYWRRYARAVRARFPDGEQATLAEAAARALRAPNGHCPDGDWRS